MLGRMCRRMTPALLAPRAFAARTWSLAASTSVAARAVRAKVGPFGEPDHQDEQWHGKAAKRLAAEASAHQRERDDGEDEGRERKLHVGDPGNEAVHPAPDIAGDETEGDADGSLDGDGEHADGQGDARAVEDGAQEIAALRVGAEEEARVAAGKPSRRQVGVEHVEAGKVEWVLRGDQRRGKRRERDEPQQNRRDHAAWPVEHEGPQRSRSGTCALPAHRRPSRLMRGSSHRLTTSARVLVTTNRKPTATR